MSSILPLSPQRVARFWSLVVQRDPDECWPWASKVPNPSKSRPMFSANGRSVAAARVALALATDSEPDGLYALHAFANGACVNPAHLRWGTALDNSFDAVCQREGVDGFPYRVFSLHDRGVSTLQIALIHRTSEGVIDALLAKGEAAVRDEWLAAEEAEDRRLATEARAA